MQFFSKLLPRSPVFFLSLILSATLLFTACPKISADNLAKVQADLPVLIQVATALATVGMSLAGVPAADVVAAGTISKLVVSAVSALSDSIKAYKTQPTSTTLEKVYAAEYAVHTDLPELLTATQIKNPQLLTQVAAGVNLVVATTDSFVQFFPPPPVTAHGQWVHTNISKRPVPSAREVKETFNKDVCRMQPACVVS